jgi:hypothetical protein
MTENLLTPSVVKLFGRVMNDLKFQYDPSTVVTGYNNLLQRQLFGQSPPPAPASPVQVQGCIVTSGSYTVYTANSTSGLATGMVVSITTATSGEYFSPNTIITNIGQTQITYTSPQGNTIPVYWFSINLPAVFPSAGAGSSLTSRQTSGAGVAARRSRAGPAAAGQSGSPDPNATITATATYVSPAVNLARIYAFSFEGAYYPLPRPSIFVVHGGGLPFGSNPNGWSTMEQAGVIAREWDLTASDSTDSTTPSDMRYWEYEKGDFSIRFDTEAGPFEQILLAAALRAGADMADRASTRSGASLSGASVSGASLSGASLSGASLSGASLSGASLRR